MSLTPVSLHSASPAFGKGPARTLPRRVRRLVKFVEEHYPALPTGCTVSDADGIKKVSFTPVGSRQDILTWLTVSPPDATGAKTLKVAVTKNGKPDPGVIDGRSVSVVIPKTGKLQITTSDGQGQPLENPKAFLGDIWTSLVQKVESAGYLLHKDGIIRTRSRSSAS